MRLFLFLLPKKQRPVWQASVGWYTDYGYTAAYSWDESANFEIDDFDGAQHWLRCKVEDCTPRKYTDLTIAPGEEYRFRTQLGQAFVIRKVMVPADDHSTANP